MPGYLLRSIYDIDKYTEVLFCIVLEKGNMALFLSENYFYLQFPEAVNYISIQKYHEFLKVIGYSCII